MLDFNKQLLEIGANVERLRETIAVILEEPELDTGMRNFFMHADAALVETHAEVQRTLPEANQRLDAKIAGARQKTEQARQQIAEVREQIKAARAKAAEPKVPAPPPPYDPARSKLIRDELLSRFGPRADRPRAAEPAGDVVEMASSEFTQRDMPATPPSAKPVTPSRPVKPAQPARSEQDITQMDSADFEALQPKDKKPATKRPGDVEGLPEDLWQD